MNYELTEMIPLSVSHPEICALIDIDDAEEVGGYLWQAHSTGYAKSRGTGKRIYMHRLINKTPKGLLTDHINGNRLDNRKANLRTATHYQNQNNIHSAAKGYQITGKKFSVRIYHNNYRYDFGKFPDEKLATHVYWDIKNQLKEAIYA